MEELVRLKYPIFGASNTDEEATLDYEERSALRYTAGYTIHSLLKKINKSRSKQSNKLKKCLREMAEDTDESVLDSAEWTRALDRGLIHVNDIIFSVFTEMELALLRNLAVYKENFCQVIDLILNDENVLFAWALASASWQEEDSNVLLQMIVEHWVTLRGFSNAKSLLEKYKRKSRQGVQNSKGLRRKLLTN